MIDFETRQRLAAYLRFQQELGVDLVNVDLKRLGWAAKPPAPARAASPRMAGATVAPTPQARMAPVPPTAASLPSTVPDRPEITRPATPARTLKDLTGAVPPPPSLLLSAAMPVAPLANKTWPEDSAPNDAAQRLKIIQDEIGPDCNRCKLHALGRKQVVFGVGNPQAELVFVGEGPGADEDEQGEPFVGRAGRLLTDMIEKGMGLRREDVYICNVVKCRPPQNRTPEADECATCGPFMQRQLRAIRPRVVCALGAVAAQNLMPYKGSLASVRGRIHEIELGGVATRLVVTYHPAYLLRDPSQKKEAWKDLQMIMKFLGIPVPGTGSEK